MHLVSHPGKVRGRENPGVPPRLEALRPATGPGQPGGGAQAAAVPRRHFLSRPDVRAASMPPTGDTGAGPGQAGWRLKLGSARCPVTVGTSRAERGSEAVLTRSRTAWAEGWNPAVRTEPRVAGCLQCGQSRVHRA